MNLRIIKAGILDSVQDMGRTGYRSLGINPAGAMDRYAMQVANILVGNRPGEAVIEMHFPAASVFFEEPAVIAISGADFSATVNAEEIPMLHPILVSKFSILQFEGMKKGARVYLAIKGGLQIPQWLGSYSTHLKAGAGGWQGRNLQKNDEIAIHTSGECYTGLIEKEEFKILPWSAEESWRAIKEQEILILPGNEWQLLTAESKENFLHHPFSIALQSDRMGYQLNGPPLSLQSADDTISSGVNFGTIQLLPDGKLIILMADHQATGGYPRVAHVISACHSQLAQMRAGDKLYFCITDQQTAESTLLKQQRYLQQLQNACTLRLQKFFLENDLARKNRL